MADKNGDGYITFTELSSYVQTAASAFNQTPGTDSLKGHELGDFVFVNRARPDLATQPGSLGTRDGDGTTRAPAADIYAILQAAIQQFTAKNYAAAREAARKAAELGNAEAMMILAKLHWEGWGTPVDRAAAMRLWRDAGERGHVPAMRALIYVHSEAGEFHNEAEAMRWNARANAAELFAQGVLVVGANGQKSSGEPSLPASAVKPSAPKNLRITP